MTAPDAHADSAASSAATPTCDAMRRMDAWNPAWDDFAALDPAWTEKFMTMGVAAMGSVTAGSQKVSETVAFTSPAMATAPTVT